MKYLIIAISSLLLFSSCEKILDIDLPENQNKLVINGIIFPDSLIRVSVSKSKNILDTSSDYGLTGASVKLYKNGEEVGEMTDIGGGFYQSQIQPEIGVDYKITADYESLTQVETNCVIPSKPQIDTLSSEIRTTTYYDGYEVEREIIKVTFFENTSEKNYYMLSVREKGQYPIYDENWNEIGYEEGTYYWSYMQSSDPVFGDDTYLRKFEYGNFFGFVFDDSRIPGNKYTIDLDLWYSQNADYTVCLSQIDEDFYKYVLSYQANRNNSGNPFTEPISVFSNVSSGMGMFSGLSMDEKTITLEGVENEFTK